MTAKELGGGEALTVNEEVSSAAYYEKHYRAPEWPGGHSGITFGIGYDIGQGAPEACRREMWDDWKGHISDDVLAVLEPCCGLAGAAAQAKLAGVRRKVDIPFATAMAVFEQRDVPKWEARIRAALPNTDKLAPDSRGSIFSLSYNRGTSYSAAGDRYREMRAIRDHMAAQRFELIPAEFRSMKRLWSNGLVGRREREALLFERGLKATAEPLAPLPPAPSRQAMAQGAAMKAVAGSGGVAVSVGAASSSVLHAAVGIGIAVVIGGIVYVIASRHSRLGKADPSAA